MGRRALVLRRRRAGFVRWRSRHIALRRIRRRVVSRNPALGLIQRIIPAGLVLLVHRVGRCILVIRPASHRISCRAVSGRIATLRRRCERPESIIRSIGTARRALCVVQGHRRPARRLRRHRRSMVLAAGRLGCNRRMAAEISRLGGSRDRRLALVHAGKVLLVLRRQLLMLGLRRRHRRVLLMFSRQLLLRRLRRHPARTAIVADVIHRGVVDDDRLVVDVGHVRDADVGDCAVVVETSAPPFAARKAHAAVAESVVNPSVEAHVRSPVSGMPRVETAAPTPITGSPQHTHWSQHPCARHPVVAAFIIPGPVARSPQKAWSGGHGLRINWQCRRTNADRDADRNLPIRSSRQRHQHDGTEQPADYGSIRFHKGSFGAARRWVQGLHWAPLWRKNLHRA